MRRLIMGLCIGLMQWGLPALPGHAADVIVLSSGGSALYQEAAAGFRAHSPSTLDVTTYDLEGRLDRAQAIGEKIRASQPQLVFAVGLKAAMVAKSQLPDTPTVFALVVHPEEHGLPTTNMVGIRYQVPLRSQLEHIRTLAPHAHRIGLLYGDQKPGILPDQARTKANALSLQLVTASVSKGDNLAEILHTLLPKIDLLWIIPDSTVLTESSVDVLLQSTLRQKIPVFTFSTAMVQRGALGALVIDPSDTGKQAAHVARAMLAHQGPSSPALLETEHAQLALNIHTAEFLGLTLPPATIRTARILFGGPGALAQEEQKVLQDFLQ